MKATGRFCKKHGGDLSLGDEWLCDTCARAGINTCKCGSPARAFSEALMSVVACESCDEFLMGVDIQDICDRWNSGERGYIKDKQEGPCTDADWFDAMLPPANCRSVVMRFDDDGSRDCEGFYWAPERAWYKSKGSKSKRHAVHPVRWREK